jgi:hypothetical protein
LLEKIADSPHRYVGLFRPTKPKAKILQNLLQSHEIRFGDAFETAIERYLEIKGCELLPKKFQSASGDILNIDRCFRKDDKIYFIEQKVRDDHDSTKKRGQILNFEKKLGIVINDYPDQDIIGIFYFIDPSLAKNSKFYTAELTKMAVDYKMETAIFYAKQLFNYLGYGDVWEETIEYLKRWKEEIPDFPEINFDLNAIHTFEEIKDLSPAIFRKLLSNDVIFEQIVLTLFPEKTTLVLLQEYFKTKPLPVYGALVTKIGQRLA